MRTLIKTLACPSPSLKRDDNLMGPVQTAIEMAKQISELAKDWTGFKLISFQILSNGTVFVFSYEEKNPVVRGIEVKNANP